MVLFAASTKELWKTILEKKAGKPYRCETGGSCHLRPLHSNISALYVRRITKHMLWTGLSMWATYPGRPFYPFSHKRVQSHGRIMGLKAQVRNVLKSCNYCTEIDRKPQIQSRYLEYCWRQAPFKQTAVQLSPVRVAQYIKLWRQNKK